MRGAWWAASPGGERSHPLRIHRYTVSAMMRLTLRRSILSSRAMAR